MMIEAQKISCPTCRSLRVARNGTHPGDGAQKCLCKVCGSHFRRHYKHLGWSAGSERRVLELSTTGLSVRAIADKLSISPTTVQKWRRTLPSEFWNIVRASRTSDKCASSYSNWIKSPLRYPGGKSKAISFILPHIPGDIIEYREPFVGGASVFLGVQSFYGKRIASYWINDIDEELVEFWRCARDDVNLLIAEINALRTLAKNGRALYVQLQKSTRYRDRFKRAARYFILNRITFSGVARTGGYSQEAYNSRLTTSSIKRLFDVAEPLKGIKIASASYEVCLERPGKKVFIFIDPPYFSNGSSRLYGKKGELHTEFDHEKLAHDLRRCRHRWLLTYDDSPEIRGLYKFAKTKQWSFQYGMNNFKQREVTRGQELLIMNY